MIEEFYVENCNFAYGRNGFFSTGQCGDFHIFQQALWEDFFFRLFHSYSFHIPQPLWKNEKDKENPVILSEPQASQRIYALGIC